MKFTTAFFIVILSALPFLSALESEFVSFDDPYLCFENPLVKNFDLKKAFSSTSAEDYLPLVTASFAVEWKLFGFDPFYFHLDNLLLHLMNVLLVFYLLSLILPGSLLIPGVTALLFGIHPLHVESVLWVSQRKDVLSTLFSLQALVFYFYSIKVKRHNWIFYILSLGCFLLALFSKFMAVSLPAVIVLLAWLQGEQKKKTALKIVPYLSLMLVFAVLHLRLHNAPELNPMDNLDILAAVKRGFDSFAFYLTKTVLPFKLGVFYERDVVKASWLEYTWLVIWTVVFGGAIKHLKQQRRLIVFSLLLFLVTLFPVLQILPFGNGFAFGDRFMYFPSIGVFCVVAMLLAVFVNSRYAYIKFTAVGFLLGGILSVSYLSFAQAQTWKNSETLWQNVLSHYPRSSVALNNLGVEYFSKGKISEAQKVYLKAIEVNPKYAEPHVNLAVLYLQANAVAEAESELVKALALDPRHPGAYYNFGIVAEREDQITEAQQRYQKVIELDPSYSAAYVNLGSVYYRLKKNEAAIGILNQVLAVDPAVPEAHNNLGVIYMEMGRLSEAAEALKLAIQWDPVYEEPRKSLAVVYARLGLMDLAAKELQQVIELSKQNQPKSKRRMTSPN